MPPAVKRNRCVVLYDLKSKNERELRQALFKVYFHYYFKHSKNLMNLVLVNSDKTSNRKHAFFGKGYLHINEVNSEEEPYDPKYIYDKIELKSAGISEGANWKEAIRVAIDILLQNKVARIITFQILYFTDLNFSAQSEESTRSIMSDLRRYNIYLYIIVPQVLFSQPIMSLEEIPNCMKSISFVNENEHLAQAKKDLIDGKSKVVISDVKRGLQLFFNYRNPPGKQPWMVPLTIGTKISFAIATSKYTAKVKGLKLKPKSKYKKYPRYVFTSTEDSTKIYHEDNVRKGISRHGKFIPVQNNDIFKSKTERTFSLVFITSLKTIPEYLMKGPSCNTVIANRKSSQRAFNCFLSRLQEEKSCLIVRRVYNKGNRASFYALVPVIKKKCFRAVQLPFASEVPFEWMEQEPRKDDSVVQNEVSNYLEKITIGSPNCALNHTFTPNVVSSVKGKDVLNMAADKLLNEKLHLDQVDYDVFKTGIDPHIGDGLRAIWPTRKLDKVKEVINYDLDSDNENYF